MDILKQITEVPVNPILARFMKKLGYIGTARHFYVKTGDSEVYLIHESEEEIGEDENYYPAPTYTEFFNWMKKNILTWKRGRISENGLYVITGHYRDARFPSEFKLVIKVRDTMYHIHDSNGIHVIDRDRIVIRHWMKLPESPNNR